MIWSEKSFTEWDEIKRDFNPKYLMRVEELWLVQEETPCEWCHKIEVNFHLYYERS